MYRYKISLLVLMILVLIPAVQAYPIMDTDTVALYYMNDSSTPTVLWGRNTTGDSFNGSFFASGEPSYLNPNGLLFDGVSDYVTMDILNNPPINGSIEIIINPTNTITGATGALFMKQDVGNWEWESVFMANGSLSFVLYDIHDGFHILYSTTTTWNAGEDYKIKYVWGNVTGMGLYVNDTLEVSNTYQSRPYNGTADFWFGSYKNGVSSFDGTIKYLEITKSQFKNDTAPDNVTIESPINTTYHINKIWLNVTEHTAIDAWNFSLDNITGNVSFTPNMTISLGTYLPGNNILGAHNITICGNATIDSLLYCDTVYFSFSYVDIDNESMVSTLIETDLFIYWVDFNIYNWSAVSSIDVDFMWNNTLRNSSTGLGDNYSSGINIPEVPAAENVESYWNYTVCYLWGSCTEYNSTIRTVSITIIDLTSCAGAPGDNTTLIIRGWNESSSPFGLIHFDAGLTIKIGLRSKHYNYSFSGDDTYYLCLQPADETYIADIDIEYKNTTTDIRYYYLRQVILTNTTKTYVNLYMLDSYRSEQTDHTIQDTNYKDQTNLVIKAMRYFPGLNQYIIVASGLTGPNGETSMYLQRDVYYKWLIEANGTVLFLSDPETLTDLDIMHYIDINRRDVFFQYYDKIASECHLDEPNTLIICSYSDTSGKLLDVSLTAKRMLPYNHTKAFCTKTSTSPANTLICNYAGYENDTVLYVLEGHFHGSGEEWFDLVVDFIEGPAEFLYGESLGTGGIILALIVVMVFILLMLYEPKMAVTGSAIGLVVAWLFGLYAVSLGALVGFLIALGFIVWTMGRSKWR